MVLGFLAGVLPEPPIPIFPSLRILQAEDSDAELILTIMNHAPNLQAFDLIPRIEKISPLLASFAVTSHGRAPHAHDGLEPLTGMTDILFVPHLRFLRLRLPSQWLDRGTSNPGDATRMHHIIAKHLIDILKTRNSLKVEVVIIKPTSQNRLNELRAVYAPSTSESGDQIGVRALVDSDLVDLADCYEIV